MISSLSLAISALSSGVLAQGEPAMVEEVVVTGIRSALQSALNEKQNATNLVEVIMAEDIGKLPDQNLAEVLENVTGVQITRTAGVGTGVQIRGTSANQTLINGVATVGSGSGRTGISFEDLSASIIAGVEVTKAPDAKTIEGSVGGTVNLRTIRPLDLEDMLVAVRIQGEDSSLSDASLQPRYSGTFGNNWSTGIGDMGFVISGSITEQESTSFRPRVDRDGGLVENVNAVVQRTNSSGVTSTEDQATRRPAAQSFDFVGMQFFNQEYENFEYDTTNVSTTFEWAPNDKLKLFADAIITDQERRQDSSRVQASGLSSVLNYNVPTDFETVNFGSLGGKNLGSIQVGTKGKVLPNLAADDDDPNLRFSSDTGARITDSSVFRLGGVWQDDKYLLSAELARADADTVSPDLSTTLNFINPNCPLDGTSNDNCVPFVYDLSGGALTFGVDFDSMYSPEVAHLTDPNNVVLDAVAFGRNTRENSNDAWRIDLTYYLEWGALTSVDVGYRWNRATNTFNDVGTNWGQSQMVNSPNGSLFEELLVRGPDNFDSADGRKLAFTDFLIIDPDRAFNDPNGTLAILQAAVAAHGGAPLGNAEASASAFFDIKETTDALYAQANFEYGMFRGNLGLRYLTTDVESRGNTIIDGQSTRVTTSGDYSYLLPRLNLVVSPTEDLLIRAGWGEDIRRPDFNDLSTSVTFGSSPNSSVAIGNPNLEPEEVESFDISVEWYFAPAAVASIGYFHKERTNLFVSQLEDAAVDNNGFRDITPPCEGGGIFNPVPDRNVLSNIPGNGLCVPIETIINDTEETTQSGWELSFQYDLADFEDKLGWASGFGIIANYTIQDFEGGEATNSSATRGTDIFNAINGIYDDRNFETVEAVQGLLDFSETAYNFTLFYEKHGISARARYTWREAFRTEDTAGGATLSSTYGFPVVTEDRGQLNMSINYDINENFNIGVEAVNVLEEEITQSCVNEGAILCFQGIPDRRITFGLSYRM
ncbi:MAG: TonB-dependent receptor [Gammaproteobacteria bacterium]|nr:TonB-dependent receptor [Gammaproteobacteria bacterium]